MAKRKFHIVPRDYGWAVKRENTDRASGIFDTKKQAIDSAEEMASKDGGKIIIHNREGKIVDSYWMEEEGEDCFITTACVNFFGLNDDCYQLNTLRRFRDEYLLKTKEGKELVSQYYLVAPKIVAKLNKAPDNHYLYKKIFSKINLACLLIEKSEYEKAKKLYSSIVLALLQNFQLK